MKIKESCSYCGGLEADVPGDCGQKELVGIRLHREIGDGSDFDVDICVICFTKVFDTILGQPGIHDHSQDTP